MMKGKSAKSSINNGNPKPNDKWEIDYIGRIIDRIANNHTKWYAKHLGLFGVTITLYAVTFGFIARGAPSIGNATAQIVLQTIFWLVTIVTNIVSFLIFLNSWKNLEMERAFRKMQAIEWEKKGTVSFPYTQNWKEYKTCGFFKHTNKCKSGQGCSRPKKKYGQVYWVHIFISIIILITTVVIPVVALYVNR